MGEYDTTTDPDCVDTLDGQDCADTPIDFEIDRKIIFYCLC